MADDAAAGKLRDFESFLRGSVCDALAAMSEDWWNDLVPEDVKGRAERAFQARSPRGSPPGSKAECLELSDCQEIIDGNWDGVFAKVFRDRRLARSRFAGLTAIRNRIAQSGAMAGSERKRFECSMAEIKGAFLASGPDHETAATYLEGYGGQIVEAYRGAVWAIRQDRYPDQMVQFAHSLREVIDLLAKAGQKEGGTDIRRRGGRAAAIQKAVDPRGGSSLCDDYALLEGMYDRLSGIAHHRKPASMCEALAMLGETCRALLRIARPQLEVGDEVERAIGSGPGEHGARRLAELSIKEVTRTRMARLLTDEWLPHLIKAGLFGGPSPGVGDGGGRVRMPRPLSAYLARCAQRFPDEVSRLVLAYPAGGVRSGPYPYYDFLRCAARFGPEDMEKAAQKARDEGWIDISAFGFVEPFAALVEGLFQHKKYEAGSALAYDILNPAPWRTERDSEPEVRPHDGALDGGLFESAVREVARRAVRACPENTIKLLVRLLEAHAREGGRGPWEWPGRVASVEDSMQNGNAPVNAVVSELRDALEDTGRRSPGLLKSIMPALYRKSGMLFRRMELHIYRRFPQAFAKEAALSLHMYFGIAGAHHEYYHLLRESFDGMPKQARESLYASADRARSGSGGFGPGSDPASVRLARKKFLFLHAVRAHLGTKHAEEYEMLCDIFGEPSHPDYLSYVKVSLGGGTASAAPPGGGDADSVLREAVSSEPPTGPFAEYEDEKADRLEARVEQYPNAYISMSAKLKEARPAIQYAFFAGVETALQKKRLPSLPDLGELFTHVIGLELNDPLRRGRYRQWDPLLRICWLLNTSFKEDAVEQEQAKSLGDVVLALAEAGARRGSSDCNGHARDAPTGAISFGSDPHAASSGKKYTRDALTGAINSVDGLSFILLFRCWLWRKGEGDDGKRFGSDLRRIVDEYIDGGAGRHTACRHSAIGLFAAAIFQEDPEWFQTVVKRMERTEEKASFWSAYVMNNYLYENMFRAIWKYYDMFLNGKLLYQRKLDEVVDATFRHVALAYLYGFEHADGIFDRFVKEARPEMIKRTVMPLAFIMKDKADDAAFDRKKLAKLWKEERFSQLDLGIWFWYTPLDKKTAIGLYRDYLERYRGRINMVTAPVDGLEDYAKEFPGDTASCLLRIVERGNLVDDQAVERVVGRLEAHGGQKVGEKCRDIREALAKRGLGPGGSE